MIQILYPEQGESWQVFLKRVRESEGDTLIILSGREAQLIEEPETRKAFLVECKKLSQRLRLATKHPAIAAEARAASIRVLDRTKHVRALLHNHPKQSEALRIFSPQLWRQQLTTRMQKIGLLSVPKLRIYSLVLLSALLFFFVIFKLLPSAEVRVSPRQESVSQTVNIFLVQSGSTADISPRVRRKPLYPIPITIKKSTTFDHISKEFIGRSSVIDLTIINKSPQQYPLRKDTRFSNQAGMVFRITSHAIVDPGEEVTVQAVAEDTDLYGQIIGDRGNVPANLRWEIPGLAVEERALVYGENRKPGRGGTTAYRAVLKQEDLDLAKKRLEQELLAEAKIKLRALIEERNTADRSQFLQTIDAPQYQALIKTEYHDFVLPTDLLGSEVQSINVEGAITYTVLAYDTDAILDELLGELRAHVRKERRLIDDNIGHDQLVAHVIDYADDLSWVKLTVDLTGTEEYVLDPLSPTGALFGKTVRDNIVGVRRDEALRIIKNMPEVERVEISQWPPWNTTLPVISSHISIVAQ